MAVAPRIVRPPPPTPGFRTQVTQPVMRSTEARPRFSSSRDLQRTTPPYSSNRNRSIGISLGCAALILTLRLLRPQPTNSPGQSRFAATRPFRSRLERGSSCPTRDRGAGSPGSGSRYTRARSRRGIRRLRKAKRQIAARSGSPERRSRRISREGGLARLAQSACRIGSRSARFRDWGRGCRAASFSVMEQNLARLWGHIGAAEDRGV